MIFSRYPLLARFPDYDFFRDFARPLRMGVMGRAGGKEISFDREAINARRGGGGVLFLGATRLAESVA